MSRPKDNHCEECDAFCQGFRAPDGKLLCADCLWKIWEIRPDEAESDD